MFYAYLLVYNKIVEYNRMQISWFAAPGPWTQKLFYFGSCRSFQRFKNSLNQISKYDRGKNKIDLSLYLNPLNQLTDTPGRVQPPISQFK